MQDTNQPDKDLPTNLPTRAYTRPDYLLATGFGAGLVPFASGTVGSALGLLLLTPLAWLRPEVHWWVHLLMILVGFVVGVKVCSQVAADLQDKDPSSIVWDEIVGMWISLLLVPFVWYWWLLAFVLFRFFDVLKPWPASWADRQLEGGMGIMLDDVFAGLYTLAAVHLISLLNLQLMTNAGA